MAESEDSRVKITCEKCNIPHFFDEQNCPCGCHINEMRVHPCQHCLGQECFNKFWGNLAKRNTTKVPERTLDEDKFICTECKMHGPQNMGQLDKHSSINCVYYRLSHVAGLEVKEAKRNPTKFRYDILDPEFLKFLAQIAHYGGENYGDLNWQKSRLEGDKSPINHIYKHLGAYRSNDPYDHKELGQHRKWHLAAIAFNAMMEFWYESQKS